MVANLFTYLILFDVFFYIFPPTDIFPGVQTRTPFCIDTKSQSRVNDELCEENNATKPEYEKSCETVDCEAEWFTGDWEDCSQTCGNQGEQYRVVYCHEVRFSPVALFTTVQTVDLRVTRVS